MELYCSICGNKYKSYDLSKMILHIKYTAFEKRRILLGCGDCRLKLQECLLEFVKSNQIEDKK